MKSFRALLIVCLLIIFVTHSCSINDDYVKEGVFADVTSITFPSIPIEIANNQEFEKPMINYFNIIKAGNLYYMYYLAFNNTTNKSDLDQNLYFAYSNDLIIWKREKVAGGDNLLVTNIADASVSYNKELQTPFRLVGRQMIDGENYLVMYKSKDGCNFEFDRYLFKGKYDTQSTCVEQSEGFKLYTRHWNKERTNRQIGYALFDKEDKCIDSLQALNANYVYNPGVLKINDNQDILMPTYMNNLDGGDDNYKILSFRKKETNWCQYQMT